MHNLFGFIPLDERFWVALSFVIFCLISFLPFKKLAIGAMDKKIISIKNLIQNSHQLSEQTAKTLVNLNTELEKINEKSRELILQAQQAAKKIEDSYSQKLQNLSVEIRASNKQKLAFLQKEKTSYIYKIVCEAVFKKVLHAANQGGKFNEIQGVNNFNFSSINK